MTTTAPAEVHLRTDPHTGREYHRVLFHRITGAGIDPWRVWVERDGRTWRVYSTHTAFNTTACTKAAARAFIARTKAELGAL